MKLYLMRHGPAEDRAESGVDADRALTSAGRERVRAVAKALFEAGEAPLYVLTSPLVRAVQTAEIVALAVATGPGQAATVSVRREVGPGGAALALSRRLAGDAARRVMLVGHEPDLSELAGALLGAAFDRPFDKAMVLGVHLSAAGEARCRFVLDPKSLRFERPDS